jgi:15-cis-phytoene synthase
MTATRPAPPRPDEWTTYLGAHGRSFSMAAALMPEPHRTRIVGVYAFCRYTDDLVDRGLQDREALLHKLDVWLSLARRAYYGRPAHVALLDRIMPDMAESDVPFAYVEALIEGMRMDVRGTRYDTIEELRDYCHHVASVVGLWLTELFGVHDAWTLQRAARLGTAMQLTNIIRDVGEDWDRGRLYLPRDLMRRHGVTEEMLTRLRRGDARMPASYAALMEEMIGLADADYRYAAEGLPMLPAFFRPAVAVSARVYASIHDAVRENGYDTLRQRAVTSMPRKIAILRATLAMDEEPAPGR